MEVHEGWKVIIRFSNLCPLVTLMKQFQLVVEKKYYNEMCFGKNEKSGESEYSHLF